MEASPPSAKPISISNILNETFSIYGSNVGVLIGAAIAVFVVVGIAVGLLQAAGGVVALLIAAIIQLAAFALFTGFVVRLVEDVRDGRRDQTVGDLFSSAVPAIASLIAFGILFGIGVGIGFLLIIIPGLILLTFWSVGAPAIVVEGAGPIEAFGRSWRLVRGDAWSVFATLVIVWIIVVLIGIVLGLIATPIGDAANVIASIIANVITAPIFAIAVSTMFFDLGGGRAVEAAPAPAQSPPPPPPTA